MGLFNGSTQPTTEQSNEWKNASMDFASLLGSQNMINPVSTQSSQQQRVGYFNEGNYFLL
jgi:hypothetical protein